MKYSSGEGKLEVSVYSFFGPINAFFPQRVRSMILRQNRMLI